jgi:hypothetical protein
MLEEEISYVSYFIKTLIYELLGLKLNIIRNPANQTSDKQLLTLEAQ